MFWLFYRESSVLVNQNRQFHKKSHHLFDYLLIYVSRQTSDTYLLLTITFIFSIIQTNLLSNKCRQIDSIITEFEWNRLLNWKRWKDQIYGSNVQWHRHNSARTTTTTKTTSKPITTVRNNTKANVNLNCIIVFLFVNFDLHIYRNKIQIG